MGQVKKLKSIWKKRWEDFVLYGGASERTRYDGVPGKGSRGGGGGAKSQNKLVLWGMDITLATALETNWPAMSLTLSLERS